MTYDDISSRFTDPRAVAEKLGVKPHVVRDFSIRGRIPAEYFLGLVNLNYCTADEILSAAAKGTCSRKPKGERRPIRSTSL